MKTGPVALVLSGAVLTAVLYLLPYAPLSSKNAADQETERTVADYSIMDDVTEVNNELDSATLSLITGYETKLEREGLVTYADSLIAVYDMLRKPVPSAYHALKKAEKTNAVDAWTEAGERFLLNAKYMGGQNQKTAWYATAKESFEKALTLVPDDMDIKVDLGVCMVEGASFLGVAPMQGIGVLREVEQLDPNNIKALINLGYFSIRSGQFDKAEERFKKVLLVDPDYIDAYLYMADMFEKQQKTKEAVDILSEYMNKVEDPQRKAEVGKYIQELSSKIQ
jgi:tetratricopeptide (TPR) repeat protein